jgi:hypothetical protein
VQDSEGFFCIVLLVVDVNDFVRMNQQSQPLVMAFDGFVIDGNIAVLQMACDIKLLELLHKQSKKTKEEQR